VSAPSTAAPLPVARPLLLARLPGPRDGTEPDTILDRFLGWVEDSGLSPYPAQEEALLELMAGKHVILSTPTGSGKSLVATALHFKALAEGKRSFYTCPVKALASEKFFALCQDFGAVNVGMLTGDASINFAAPIICCTAEVLANMALRQGEALDAPYVVMDEFHYYSDRDRGMAWQIPLLTLPHATFLLMSATLGPTLGIEDALRSRTGREIAHVTSRERPVPLDFEYREELLHETVEKLGKGGKAPVYVVSFTQRECAELAQALTSMTLTTREERQRITEAIGDFRFDSPYGKEVQRFVRAGIGIHHAGLLPKYRLLVERLSQQGLLEVICGTDTLGVGVNVPIRTVLFTKLCKFDGEKTTILSVRDFKQIAGRAGRKGFDERGSVVCQAPEHVVLNRRLEAKAADPRTARKKLVKAKPPNRGFLPWNKDTFERLITQDPEPLISRFRVNHGMVLSVLQREAETEGEGSGYQALLDLVERSHEDARAKRRLRRELAQLFRSLRRAGIVEVARNPVTRKLRLRVHADLQRDFSLHRALSLYLVDAVSALDPQAPNHALDVLSLVEAILENPRAVLLRQVDRAKALLIAELKSQGVPYEDRIRQLDEVTFPKPLAEFIYATFNLFAEKHPWLEAESIHPKSIAREMAESFMGFHDYVRAYGLERSEGLLLRYLGQVYTTLSQNVPEALRTDELEEIRAYLRAMLEQVDASLMEEWESLVHPEPLREPTPESLRPQRRERDLAADPRVFAARVRQEWHRLVQLLAERDWEEAARSVRQDPEDPWEPRRFQAELAPFFAEYGEIVTTPAAREKHLTQIQPTGPRTWDVMQTLVDPQGDNLFCLFGHVDLLGETSPEGPIIRMRRIGT
jgi:superfamily II RNA helicase